MKILFCGDVVARSGREVIQKYIPILKKGWGLDCVIVNGENAQHGCGLSSKICEMFFEIGVDVITTGNHVWDHKELFSYIEKEPRVLRPINFMELVPGNGHFLFKSDKGDVLVLNAMGQVFIEPLLNNPFPIIEKFITKYPLGQNNLKAIVVDFHGEATSEKIALAYYLDGKISAVFGTHTHMPTADERILKNGTAYLSDVGMCGDYNSIIGAPLESLVNRYIKKIPMTKKPDPAIGEGTFCAVYLETDNITGLTNLVHPVKIGPILTENWPQHLDKLW